MSEMKTASPRIPSPLTAGIAIDHHSLLNKQTQQIRKQLISNDPSITVEENI